MPAAVPTWRTLARQAGLALRGPRAELLEMVDRVIVREEGFGLSDPERGRRGSIPMRSTLLARKAAKRDKGPKPTERTYRRALKDLELLGVLFVERRPGIPPMVSPAWTQTPDPMSVWTAAAERIRAGEVSGYCPPYVRVLSGYCPGTPSRSEQDLSQSTAEGSAEVYPDNSGGRLNAVTVTSKRQGYGDTVFASRSGERRPDQTPRLGRIGERRPTVNARFDDPEDRDEAQQLIDTLDPETGRKAAALIGMMVRDADLCRRSSEDQGVILETLREACSPASGIEHPVAWMREVFDRTFGIGTGPAAPSSRRPPEPIRLAETRSETTEPAVEKLIREVSATLPPLRPIHEQRQQERQERDRLEAERQAQIDAQRQKQLEENAAAAALRRQQERDAAEQDRSWLSKWTRAEQLQVAELSASDPELLAAWVARDEQKVRERLLQPA